MATAALVPLTQVTRMGLAQYAKNWKDNYFNANPIRTRMEFIDQDYARTINLTIESERARLSNRYGNKEKLQNLVVPVVMPQTEAALAFLTEVFLSGNPIFAISADPARQDTALMYNTIIEDAQNRGGWVAEFIKFFRDGLKYNLHAIELDWCRKNIFSVHTDLKYELGIVGKPKELLWQGNRIRRLDMYNTFFDWRVPPHLVHSEGEFAGYVEVMSRVRLKKFIEDLPSAYTDSLDACFASGIPATYYIPQVNLDPLIHIGSKDFSWLAWLSNIPQNTPISGNFQNAYEVMTLYCRILPIDFNIRNVPSPRMPQIWKLIIINDHHLIYAERQTNAHDNLGIILGQPINDGLGFQTRSFSDNISPFQDIASALWNAKLNSARRRLTDRMLFNPAMVRATDINSPEPNAKIPVRNIAYGKTLQEAVYQIPFEDEGSQYFIQEANGVIDMSFFASGQNRVSQGQFQKGNKTVREFDTTMGNANARDRMMAMFIEAQTMQPAKEMIKYNILQYQPSGKLYSRENEAYVDIDPVKLRETAVEFKVSDGLTPIERLMSTDEFTVAMQTIQAVPQLNEGYRLVPMFSYLMKLRGLKYLQTFEKPEMLQMFEKQLASWEVIATEAVKAGQEPPPQPQMPPELQQFLQQQMEQQAKAQGLEQQQAPQQQQTGTPPPQPPQEGM